jgi:WD40 repeat protein
LYDRDHQVQQPVLFLSHSGADTPGARELKQRLLASPSAIEHGLTVWFDKDNLIAGRPWQPQIEAAIEQHATAFAVYVGSQGIINWVENEVRLGLSRSTGSNGIPFIPILTKHSVGSTALPPFARQYQGVRDPLENLEEFDKLIRAVLGFTHESPVALTDRPFIGLEAMSENDADRFFGRDLEVVTLVQMFRRHNLIAIVADSGAGKSSLAMAGFAPAFRGNALASTSGKEPEDLSWHVVIMRPGRDPMQGLRDGIEDAATLLGRGEMDKAHLRKQVDVFDPGETAYALRCGLPRKSTRTLLIVDQFEEIFTQTPTVQRAPFIDLIMNLVEGAFNTRVLLTVREDHFNLCRPYPALFAALWQNDQDAILRLKRISDDGLRSAVIEPLKMTGKVEPQKAQALAKYIQRDLPGNPGSLALAQMALHSVWQRRQTFNDDLLQAYAGVGGIAGALAFEAEDVRLQLEAKQQSLLFPVLARLIRLGDTGGATRRIADFSEFNPDEQALIHHLSTVEGARLVTIGERTVEIGHESLITQWPWLQEHLQLAAPDKRIWDNLIEDARNWRVAKEDPERVARGYDLAAFTDLCDRRPEWLSLSERRFIDVSKEVAISEETNLAGLLRNARQSRNVALVVAALAVVSAGAALDYYFTSQQNLFLAAITKAESLLASEQPAHAWVMSDFALQQVKLFGFPFSLISLKNSDDEVRAAAIVDIARPATQSPAEELRFGTAVLAAAYSHDGTRFALGDQSGRVTIRQVDRPQNPIEILGPASPIRSVRFSPDDTRIAVAFDDGSVLIRGIDDKNGQVRCPSHRGGVNEIAYQPSGKLLASAGNDGKISVCDPISGKEIVLLSYHNGAIGKYLSVVFSEDGGSLIASDEDGHIIAWNTGDWSRRYVKNVAHGDIISGDIISIAVNQELNILVAGSLEGYIDIHKLDDGSHIGSIDKYQDKLWRVALSPNRKLLAVAYWNGTIRFWSVEGLGQAGVDSGVDLPYVGAIDGNDGWINDLAFSPDSKYVLTASEDGIARTWDVSAPIPLITTIQVDPREALIGRYNTDGSLFITGGRDRQARVYSVDEDGQFKYLCHLTHQDWVSTLLFFSNGNTVLSVDKSADADHDIIHIWNAGTCSLERNIDLGDVQISDIALSKDDKYLAIAYKDEVIKVFSIDSRHGLGKVTPIHATGRAVDFSPNGRELAVGTSGKEVALVSLDTGTADAVMAAKHSEVVDVVRFSPDGRLIASVGETPDEQLMLWDWMSGKITTLQVRGGAGAPVFSADGSVLAAGSDKRFLSIWKIADWKKIFILDNFVGVRGVFGFNPKDGDLAFDGQNGLVRVLRKVLSTPVDKPIPHASVLGTDAYFDNVH